VEGLDAHERIDVDALERAGVLLRDLLDVDAALGGDHRERTSLAAVEQDRRVVLLADVRGFLDPDQLDGVALDVHAEDVRGVLLGFRG
jgi:hypothetical protein